MRDVVVLAVIAAFFALCVAYVRWCDRIIGPDPDRPGRRRRRRRIDACRRSTPSEVVGVIARRRRRQLDRPRPGRAADDLPGGRARAPGEVLMTGAGLFQLVALLRRARRDGDRRSGATWPPSTAPGRRLGARRSVLRADRAGHLPAAARRPAARAALERLRHRAAGVQPGVVPRRVRAAAAPGQRCRSTRRTCRPWRRSARSTSAVSFMTNTNWQWYSRRADDEPPHADGRPDGAELRVGGGRHGRRRGDHPRHRPPRPAHARQLLGRPRPARRCASCCRCRSSSPSLLSLGGVVQNFARSHRGDAGRRRRRRRGHASRSPAARWPARSRSSSSARTAAASSTPTRRTRSRTRTGITNFLEIWAILLIPFAFVVTFGVLVGSKKQARVLLAVMAGIWLAFSGASRSSPSRPATRTSTAARRRPGRVDASSSAATWRARRCASAPATCGLWAGVDDRHVERRGELHARQLHAARRDVADGAHEARRGQPGRRRRRPDGHADLRPAGRVHRRADGRANTGVPRQEDPGRRDEARRALHPRHAAGARWRSPPRRWCSTSARRRSSSPAPTACPRCSTTSPRRPTTTARRSPARAPAPTGTR